MALHENSDHHLEAFAEKMRKEGLAEIVFDTFAHYYRKVVSGEKGMIPDEDIRPISSEDIADFDALGPYETVGKSALKRTVKIVLNGGLGTSMGLTGPKSLLEVKDGRSFLEIILLQTHVAGVRLALMNSFSTDAATKSALDRISPPRMPDMFLQHKFPKVSRGDLRPATWSEDPGLEWNPPGHGDIYTALYTSGMLERLLAEDIEYAFISNSDNLGAVTDTRLVGYFAEKGLPFMMEVAHRTPSDKKGGHLARHENGRLVLREIAQCPDEDLGAFEDIRRFRFFNTNNLWVNLRFLKRLIDAERTVRLPMIVNPKRLDPRNAGSPEVYQIETAMGAAISLFEGATAVRVPESRFYPVKKCNDLLAVRSDCYIFGEGGRLEQNPERRLDRIKIDLDPSFYGKIDDFDARFPEGPPSLVQCESLAIRGDVLFEKGVALRGKIRIENRGMRQAVIAAGAEIKGEKVFG